MLTLAILSTAVLSAAPATPTAFAKMLMTDASSVQSSANVALTLGKVEKFGGNPLFGEEYPWEPRFDNMYPNVIWDAEAGCYKCWYSPFVIARVDQAKSRPGENLRWKYRESGLCYATSRDGLHWQKPLFQEFRFEGRPSNLIYRRIHGVGVFRDGRETDPSRRYKMICRDEEAGSAAGLATAFSEDGIHWSKPKRLPNVPVQADTHNNAIWAPTLGEYVALTRDWDKSRKTSKQNVRLISRIASADFANWSQPECVLRGEDDELQCYAMPIFFSAGIYYGLPAIFDVRENRVHVELAWSPDTKHWTRIDPGRPFIANGPAGSYDYGCIFAAATPIVSPEGIRIYYGASDNKHGGYRHGYLALAMLRPDGFAGLGTVDPARTGEIVTRVVPLPAAVAPVFAVTADIESGGSLALAVLDAETGREFGRSEAIKGERHLTSASVKMNELERCAGKNVRLKLILRDAIVYSLEIQPAYFPGRPKIARSTGAATNEGDRAGLLALRREPGTFTEPDP